MTFIQLYLKMGQIFTLASEKGERIYLKAFRHDYPSEADLTWEDRFNVPGHDSIQEGIKQHHDSWRGDAKAIFFQWALKEVVPLNTNSLLLEQCKVLATKTKGYWRQQALKMGGMNMHWVLHSYSPTSHLSCSARLRDIVHKKTQSSKDHHFICRYGRADLV